MRLMDILSKLFVSGDWHIAYRAKDNEVFLLADMPINQWCADPFVYCSNEQQFIFVEQYRKDKDKGCIGYYKIEDGIPINKGVIIENSYHMSYPDVFEYDGQYFMIPESSANKTVDLYVADRFPDKWHKVKTLINGEKYVDSTVYYENEHYYLFTYNMTNCYEIHIFELDMRNQTVNFLSKKHYSKNIARPGGRLFVEDGKLMRPAQDCSHKYGECLIIYQVDAINQSGTYLEHEVRRVGVSNYHIQDFKRLHHITSDEKIDVVDVYKERFDLFHALKIFIRSRRK